METVGENLRDCCDNETAESQLISSSSTASDNTLPYLRKSYQTCMEPKGNENVIKMNSEVLESIDHNKTSENVNNEKASEEVEKSANHGSSDVCMNVNLDKPSINATKNENDENAKCIDADIGLECVKLVVEDILNNVIEICTAQACNIVEAVEQGETCSDNDLSSTSDSNSEKLLKSLLNRELRVSLINAERTYKLNGSPANVVIDLRWPPLVPVCTVYQSEEAGRAEGSSSSCRLRRPQTAIRGRRHRGIANCKLTGASDTIMLSGDEQQYGPSGKESQKLSSEGESDHRSLRSANRRNLRKRGKNTEAVEESSDEECMRVQTVNRTYARHSYTPAVPSSMNTDYDDGSDMHSRFSGQSTVRKRHIKEWSPELSPSKLLKVSKNLKCNDTKETRKESEKPRLRIGPAWYSRQMLNRPPAHLMEHFKHFRTDLEISVLKRPNYADGVRHQPLSWWVRRKLPYIKKVVKVKISEKQDLDDTCQTRLTLWRLSEKDIEELQSQVIQEAAHRRVEHAMPVVMQLSQDQIETAYENVAESMKTFEIVAADSDEDEEMEQDDDKDEESYKEILEEYRRMVAEREKLERRINPVVTEYSLNRPKRLAVDYGPSAFTPIMVMEGHRLSIEKEGNISRSLSKRNSSSNSHKNSASKMSKSHRTGRTSRKTKQRKSKNVFGARKRNESDDDNNEDNDLSDAQELNGKRDGQRSSGDGVTSDDRSKVLASNGARNSSLDRRCLFDEIGWSLNQEHQGSGSHGQDGDESIELARSNSDELLGDAAPQLSAPPNIVVINPCSPPPDLGMPMLSSASVSR